MRAELAHYGGITVMIPAALVIAVWLRYASPRAFKCWLITVVCTYSIVAFSKLLFKGWGVAFQRLDIAVLSGHAMNTCLVVTVAMSLIARQCNPAFRWPAALAGLIATGWFSAYCVAPYIHPLNEALAGALLGAVAAVAFLWRIDLAPINLSPSLIGAGVVVLLLSGLLPKYSAERLLNHVAVSVSGAPRAHQEPAWRVGSTPINAE